jgi:undecaprenyl-diphosphatase
MDYVNSIILGIVQAITEFLPISSSGHLVIFHRLMDSKLLDSLTFDVMLHGGTLLAVLVYFWHDVVSIIKNFFITLFKFRITHDFKEQLPWLLALGTVPAVIAGYFLDNFIEQTFRSVYWIILMLLAGAFLFVMAEESFSKKRRLDSMTFFDALLIGLAQVLAFIPGTSRSGITIVAGLSRQFKRAEAARFSFLLSLPVVLGAVIKKITQIPLSDFSVGFVFVSVLGILTAALVGYLVIKLFLKFLENNSLLFFAVYRVMLALVLMMVFLF